MLLKIWSAIGIVFTAAVWCRCFGSDGTVSPAPYWMIGIACAVVLIYCILLRGERDWYKNEAERYIKMIYERNKHITKKGS
jgi:hypothetical protein